MTNDQALQTITPLVFVAIFFITAADFIRRRDKARFEIALLFGSLAPVLALQSITQWTGLSSRYVTLLTSFAILAEPYLLVRLVAHFRPLPRIQHVIGITY